MSDKKTKKDMKVKDLNNGDGAEVKKGDEADASGEQARDGRDPDEAGVPDEQTEPAAEGPKEDESARYMRLAADFQNYKKRTEKEKSDIYAYANEKFAADLLDVIDNFERAIAQDATTGADEQFLEGMRLIMEQLVGILERNDVKEIDAAGGEFDPNLHHAVQMEESPEHESGKVTRVIQKGYMIRDKVLRPATVIVAK